MLAFYVTPARRFDKPIRVKVDDAWYAYIRAGARDQKCTPEEEGRFLRDASEHVRIAPHVVEILAKVAAAQATEQVTPQVTPPVTPQATPQVTPHDERFVSVIDGEVTRDELQERLAIADRKHFRDAYLHPALEAGLIEMTIPDKPKSPRQKYRLTEAGRKLLASLQKAKS